VFLCFSNTLHAQQQFRIDIDSRLTFSGNPSGSIVTEQGWNSLDATNGSGSSVTIDGIVFQVEGAATDGSRVRSGGTALNRDFVFDRGQDDDVRLRCGQDGAGFPEGRWRARIWMWDNSGTNFEANIMSAGWKELDTIEFVFFGGGWIPVVVPGTEYLQNDAVVPQESTHAIEFTFYSDGDPFELFVRENSSLDRSRINAVELTRLDVGMDDSGTFALDTRNSVDTPEFPVNTRHPDVIHNTGLPETSPGSFPISMAMLKVTGGPTAMDNITFRLLAQPLYGTLQRNGSLLSVNEAFTQAQIDAGQITYERPAGTARVTDVLEMSAVDQSGNGLAGGSLFFIVGNAGEGSSGLIAVDTRNFSEFGTHTVHTDNRVHVTPDTVPGSLRQAVSNASDGETVDFDPGINGTKLVLTDGEIVVQKDLTVDGSTLVDGVTISGNNASRVVAVPAGNVELNALNLTEGRSTSNGGAIWNRGTLTLRNCTVSDSEAPSGGGIYNRNGGRLVLENTTVSDNLATNSGGGIESPNQNGLQALTLIHSTVASNESLDDGGGISGRLEHLENSIIADNTAPGTGADFERTGGSTNLAGVSLVGDLAGSGLSIGSSLREGPARLAPLADYGGGTPSMPPLPGSPVIDAAVMLGSKPALDQRGATRPNGPLPDIGAVEAFPFCTLGLVDSDGDGIDDRLEPVYAQFTVGINDHALDSDGDGVPDWAELDSMTDPLDEADFFRFKMFPSAAHDSESNPEWTFQIKTFPGLIYQLEHSGDLDDFDPMPGGQFTATGDLTELNYLLNDDSSFHRIKLVKP